MVKVGMSRSNVLEITIQEAADIAHRTPASIRHAVKRGALPLLRTEKRTEGGRDRWYVSIMDVRALYPPKKRTSGKKVLFRLTDEQDREAIEIDRMATEVQPDGEITRETPLPRPRETKAMTEAFDLTNQNED